MVTTLPAFPLPETLCTEGACLHADPTRPCTCTACGGHGHGHATVTADQAYYAARRAAFGIERPTPPADPFSRLPVTDDLDDVVGPLTPRPRRDVGPVDADGFPL